MTQRAQSEQNKQRVHCNFDPAQGRASPTSSKGSVAWRGLLKLLGFWFFFRLLSLWNLCYLRINRRPPLLSTFDLRLLTAFLC